MRFLQFNLSSLSKIAKPYLYFHLTFVELKFTAMKKIILLLFPLFALGIKTQAQSDTTVYIYYLENERSIIGRLLSDDGKDVCLLTEDRGKICFAKFQVTKIDKFTGNINQGNKIGYPNPHPSRYFYTPTGIPLEEGEGYIQTIYGAVWQFHYGVTKQFSVGLGTTIWGSPIFITAKFGDKIADKLYLSAGFQMGNFTYIQSDLNAGILFSSLTYGDKESNISIAGGYGFTTFKETQYLPSSLPKQVRVSNGTALASLSGQTRMGKRASFMAEAWYLPREQMFIGGPGIRYMKSPSKTWDFSILYTFSSDLDFAIPFPFVSYTIKM